MTEAAKRLEMWIAQGGPSDVSQWPIIADDVRAALTEIERLTRERDKWEGRSLELGIEREEQFRARYDAEAAVTAATQRAEAAEAERDAAVKALGEERALQALEGAWRPIETAPKDGAEFVAYRPLAHKTNDPAIAVVRGTPTASKSPQGVEHYTDRWCHPTHWLPLPDPPRDQHVEGDRSRETIKNQVEGEGI